MDLCRNARPDPWASDAAPALELAALYQQRWQVEQGFDELKTHLMRSRRVLRRQTPALVRQEFYCWVLAHYAVCWLLHAGASKARLRHEELSFKAHVQLLRRQQPRSGAFPPARPRRRNQWFNALLATSAKLRATQTKGLRSPRTVKRRNSPNPSHDRTAQIRTPVNAKPEALKREPRAKQSNDLWRRIS